MSISDSGLFDFTANFQNILLSTPDDDIGAQPTDPHEFPAACLYYAEYRDRELKVEGKQVGDECEKFVDGLLRAGKIWLRNLNLPSSYYGKDIVTTPVTQLRNIFSQIPELSNRCRCVVKRVEEMRDDSEEDKMSLVKLTSQTQAIHGKLELLTDLFQCFMDYIDMKRRYGFKTNLIFHFLNICDKVKVGKDMKEYSLSHYLNEFTPVLTKENVFICSGLENLWKDIISWDCKHKWHRHSEFVDKKLLGDAIEMCIVHEEASNLSTLAGYIDVAARYIDISSLLLPLFKDIEIRLVKPLLKSSTCHVEIDLLENHRLLVCDISRGDEVETARSEVADHLVGFLMDTSVSTGKSLHINKRYESIYNILEEWNEEFPILFEFCKRSSYLKNTPSFSTRSNSLTRAIKFSNSPNSKWMDESFCATMEGLASNFLTNLLLTSNPTSFTPNDLDSGISLLCHCPISTSYVNLMSNVINKIEGVAKTCDGEELVELIHWYRDHMAKLVRVLFSKVKEMSKMDVDGLSVSLLIQNNCQYMAWGLIHILAIANKYNVKIRVAATVTELMRTASTHKACFLQHRQNSIIRALEHLFTTVETDLQVDRCAEACKQLEEFVGICERMLPTDQCFLLVKCVMTNVCDSCYKWLITMSDTLRSDTRVAMDEWFHVLAFTCCKLVTTPNHPHPKHHIKSWNQLSALLVKNNIYLMEDCMAS